jgi:class 3 adenylate cyclase
VPFANGDPALLVAVLGRGVRSDLWLRRVGEVHSLASGDIVTRVADESSVQELVARGLLDLQSPTAKERRKALDLLMARGASIDDLEANADDLGYLAALIVNGGPPTMTRRELSARCGVSLEIVNRVSLAVGMPDPGPGALSANDADVSLIETFVAAVSIFGEDAALQLARVVGSATARMADAVASTYRTTVAVNALEADASGLSMVEANLELEALLPLFMTGVQQLLRRHVTTSSRPMSATSLKAQDATDLCIGFVDLVGSTPLASRLDPAALNAALVEFDAAACDLVVAAGGRVVKLIGDEIMFTHREMAAAAAAAAGILDFLDRHTTLDAGRAGLAFGTVLTRDGDCFGPTVNLAARLVGAALPGELLVDDGSARLLPSALHVGSRQVTLKGFDSAVTVVALSRAVDATGGPE